MPTFKQLKQQIGNSLISYKKINALFHREAFDYKSDKVNLGQIQAHINAQKDNIKSLHEVEFQVFSQYGDDGIIQYLIRKLNIPNKTFIEIGVENYKEANTRFLLVNNYWSGFVVDGSMEKIKELQHDPIYTRFDIVAETCFLTKNNINEVIQKANFLHPDIGLFSLDIDGNDYWVLQAMQIISPIIIIVEYNGLFGFEDCVTIPYKEDFKRGVNLPFNFYGMSLAAANELLTNRGYQLIGCNSIGNNAYFIKQEYLYNLDSCTVAEAYVFPKFTESWYSDGNPKKAKQNVISLNDLEVYDTRSGALNKINSEKIWQSLVSAKKVNRA